MSDSEYETWHVHDAGGQELRLKVRYRKGVEVTDWRDGPELLRALEQGAVEGWHAYDLSGSVAQSQPARLMSSMRSDFTPA